MKRDGIGRNGIPVSARTVLLALLLALFGAPTLAQDAAQSQEGSQAEAAQDAGTEVDPQQPVIRLGNEEVITQAQFEEEFQRAVRALALRQGLPYNEQTRELFETLRADFLEQLATRNALLQEAQARGITVSEQEVEQQITEVQQQLGEEQFQQAVEDLGFESVDAYRESLREGLLVQRVIEELRAGVEVTDQEVQSYFEENQERFAGQQLEDVREQVRAQLVNERLNEQFVALRQEQGIQTFPERVVVASEAEDGVAGGGQADTPGEAEEQPAGADGETTTPDEEEQAAGPDGESEVQDDTEEPTGAEGEVQEEPANTEGEAD